MKEKIKSCVKWVKEHRKELLIAGLSITAVILTILAIRHKDELNDFMQGLIDSIKHTREVKTTQQRSSNSCSAIEHCVTPSEVVVQISKEASAPLDTTIHHASHLAEDIVETVEDELLTVHIANRAPCDVSMHLRTLHEGWNHSAKAEEYAAMYGIVLEPGQTIVRSYPKGQHAA